MAASDVALNIVLKATDQTSAGLNSATTSLTKLEKATSLAKVAFGALAGAATTALVGALSDAANAAANDEASVLRLQQAVENSGASWDENSQKILDRIKAGQNLAFTDDQIRDTLSNLTAVTGDVNKAFDLQTYAMDLARGKGMDLATASQLVGRVAEGNVGILKRYGIVLADGATATEALGALHAKFGGQAEAYGNSTAGSIFKVKDAISEWRESIGAATGPAMGLIALLPGLTQGMTLAGSAAGAAGTLLNGMTGITIAAAAPIVAVTAAVVLAGVALWQIAQTIQVVTDHWNVFVYALQTGRLNDIPVFGFFFSKIQQVMGAIQSAISLWQNLQSVFAGAQAMQQQANAINPNVGAAVRGFAAGGDFITNGPELIMVGERAREHVTITPAGQTGTGSVVVNINGDVVGLSKTELVQQLGAIFLQQRRIAGLA